jgi:hypothetical protein
LVTNDFTNGYHAAGSLRRERCQIPVGASYGVRHTDQRYSTAPNVDDAFEFFHVVATNVGALSTIVSGKLVIEQGFLLVAGQCRPRVGGDPSKSWAINVLYERRYFCPPYLPM